MWLIGLYCIIARWHLPSSNVCHFSAIYDHASTISGCMFKWLLSLSLSLVISIRWSLFIILSCLFDLAPFISSSNATSCMAAGILFWACQWPSEIHFSDAWRALLLHLHLWRISNQWSSATCVNLYIQFSFLWSNPALQIYGWNGWKNSYSHSFSIVSRPSVVHGLDFSMREGQKFQIPAGVFLDWTWRWK